MGARLCWAPDTAKGVRKHSTYHSACHEAMLTLLAMVVAELGTLMLCLRKPGQTLGRKALWMFSKRATVERFAESDGNVGPCLMTQMQGTCKIQSSATGRLSTITLAQLAELPPRLIRATRHTRLHGVVQQAWQEE